MRLSLVFQILFSLVLMGFAISLMTGTTSTTALFDAFQRSSAGVTGRPAQSEHSLSASAEIAPIDGYTYAGRLDARLTFTDAEGGETVFDLHYPEDYNFFHDGFGPLWLANMRPDIANNPQVTPVLGNSCLQPIRGEALADNVRYRTGYKEYIVCRVLDEEGPDAPRAYDISKAKPAVIGLIWANRNHQPIDIARERCVAEARIWSSEVAKPGDRFMACVFVVDEDPAQVETFAFELTPERIIEVGGEGQSWSRAPVEARDAPRLAQYRLIQTWLEDPAAHDAAVERAFAHVQDNLDQATPQRISQLDGVEMRQDVIYFTFSARSDAEMTRRREKPFGTERALFQHLGPVVCGSTERAALLAFQENDPAYMFDLKRRNGDPMTRFGTFPNMPC